MRSCAAAVVVAVAVDIDVFLLFSVDIDVFVFVFIDLGSYGSLGSRRFLSAKWAGLAGNGSLAGKNQKQQKKEKTNMSPWA